MNMQLIWILFLFPCFPPEKKTVSEIYIYKTDKNHETEPELYQ